MQNILDKLVIFAGVVAGVLVIFAGIKFVTSQGDPGKVAQARKTFMYAIVGLAVILLSFLALFLLSKVTGSSCLKVLGFGC